MISAVLFITLTTTEMVSRDSRYVHRRWCLEDATLTVQHPKLELLVDFDDPSNFTLPANAPNTLGVRRAAAAGGFAVGGGVTAGGLGFGPEDDLLADWREIGVPPLTDE
ncbi:uncharacterized protein TM35_000232090 [Trypanosoma theileri]|uniref:Uncharacterized protein n=1 Tax=Trypanosoma theileri TaxID=67003 RepID=A0A1X0NRR4_9TRYP|nr:uncharacterized protein TM35_000232090 [Trypanosoma theileri]ORC87238.1 hypothetical protein TM35_000232090 [Trypanosoma theileri]